jgi:hypothetical protein
MNSHNISTVRLARGERGAGRMSDRISDVKRRVWHVIEIVGLMLTVVCIALTIRSFFAADRYVLQRGRERPGEYAETIIEGWFVRGGAEFLVSRGTESVPPRFVPQEPWIIGSALGHEVDNDAEYPSIKGGNNFGWGFCGLDIWWPKPAYNYGHPGREWRVYVVLPLAAPALLGMTPMLGNLRGVRRRRRIARGLCAQCGYDLRASAERCPECGSAVGNSIQSI